MAKSKITIEVDAHDATAITAALDAYYYQLGETAALDAYYYQLGESGYTAKMDIVDDLRKQFTREFLSVLGD